MALTPYEFGRETGSLQAKIYDVVDEKHIRYLSDVLVVEDRTNFAEGYRNGFIASRKLIEEMGDIEPSNAELDEKDPRLLLKNYELGEDGHLEYTGDIDDQGKLAAEAAFEDDNPFRPSEAEIDAAECELAVRDLEEGLQAYAEMVEDETRALYSQRL